MNMTSIARRAQHGVASIELALLLPVLVALLTLPFFFGMYFMHYTVAQKAAHGAARYMSTISKTEIRTPGLVNNATSAARGIAADMLGDLAVDDSLNIEIQCDTAKCNGGNNPPATIRVIVTFRLKDYILGIIDTGDFGWDVSARVTMKYAGL